MQVDLYNGLRVNTRGVHICGAAIDLILLQTGSSLEFAKRCTY